MNSLQCISLRTRWLAAGLLLPTLWAPSLCQAFHGATLCAWQRTFYAYNAIDTPLGGYYMPRAPGRCDRDPSGQCGEGIVGWQYPADAAIGCQPASLERLGQIPNPMAFEAISAPVR